jgi:hypothetical protein
MTQELNNYLSKLPIKIFKLIDGSTIIAKVLEDDGEEIMVSKPHEMDLITGDSKHRGNLVMNEWIYGCEQDEDIVIHHDMIMTDANASLKMKDFYSKAVLQNRLESLADSLDLKPNDSKSLFDDGLHPFESLLSFLDGLEPKDSTMYDKYTGYKFQKPFQERRWDWPSELD